MATNTIASIQFYYPHQNSLLTQHRFQVVHLDSFVQPFGRRYFLCLQHFFVPVEAILPIPLFSDCLQLWREYLVSVL